MRKQICILLVYSLLLEIYKFASAPFSYKVGCTLMDVIVDGSHFLLFLFFRTRPTLLLPFWDVAGYALGAGTALLGKEAAMACTVAVEVSFHQSG